MRNALHFIGFKDDAFNRAVQKFGQPDFVHRHNDYRAQAEIMDGDTVIYNCDPTDIKKQAYDDSARF